MLAFIYTLLGSNWSAVLQYLPYEFWWVCRIGFSYQTHISQHSDWSQGDAAAVSQPWLQPQPCPEVLVSPAGAGFTSVQTQHCCGTKLLRHLPCAQFPLLRIQFITSVTEMVSAEGSQHELCPVADPNCLALLSDAPTKTHHLSPEFLWRIFCSFSASISQGGSSWISLLFKWWGLLEWFSATLTQPHWWLP